MIPLRRIIVPKRVKNKVSNPTKDKIPITGRTIQGACKVGSFVFVLTGVVLHIGQDGSIIFNFWIKNFW